MELKPCPFCGGAVSVVYNSADNAFKFYHKSVFDTIHCPVIEPIMMGELETMSLACAAENWNRRVGEEETT